MAKWTFDTVHSSVGFWVRHLMVTKVHGRFTKWEGTLDFDEKDPSKAIVDVKIDASSIDTGDPGRDGHLRSADFFDVEKFPSLTFKSTKIEGSGSDLKLTGDLTLHGVTKPVTLDVEFMGRAKHPQGGERAGFSAHGSVNRKDFGVVFNIPLDAGGVALSDKVELNFDLQAALSA